MDYETSQYPIGYVARRTGLSTHVIRVWEHRYQAVTPSRSDTQRRLYSDADIDRLKLLYKLSTNGFSIGQIAQRPTAELKRLTIEQSNADSATLLDATDINPLPPDLFGILGACQSAIISMDGAALDVALMRSRVALSEQAILEELVGPLMIWTGERWHDGSIRVAQEHLATDVIKRFLIKMRDAYLADADAPTIIVCTPVGEMHEVGALLVDTLAAIEGWNNIYFGPNLPATEIVNAAMKTNACLVALSVATPGDNPRLPVELGDLRQMLPDGTHILVGGEGARRHIDFLAEHRMQFVDSLSRFRAILRETRQSRRATSAT